MASDEMNTYMRLVLGSLNHNGMMGLVPGFIGSVDQVNKVVTLTRKPDIPEVEDYLTQLREAIEYNGYTLK